MPRQTRGPRVSEDVEPDRAVPAVPADLEPLLPGEQVARQGAVGEPERLDRPAVLPDSNHPAGEGGPYAEPVRHDGHDRPFHDRGVRRPGPDPAQVEHGPAAERRARPVEVPRPLAEPNPVVVADVAGGRCPGGRPHVGVRQREPPAPRQEISRSCASVGRIGESIGSCPRPRRCLGASPNRLGRAATARLAFQPGGTIAASKRPPRAAPPPLINRSRGGGLTGPRRD